MFKCIEAKDEELIKEIYRFRYKVALEEDILPEGKEFKEAYEADEYDKYSIQYAFFDKNSEIAACVRLIHHSDVGYPAQNSLKIESVEKKKLMLYDEKMQTAELSRIFIRKDCRGIKNTRKIIDLVKLNAGVKMKEMGVICSYGALEESFLRLLLILKMPYRIIGPYQMYGNRMRAPCIMFTDEMMELNKELFLETVN